MFIRDSPYKTTHIPLCGHTQPLCTLLENKFQGPVFSRAAPSPPPHNTNNYCVSRRNHFLGQFLCKNLLENTFKGPMFKENGATMVRATPYCNCNKGYWI